MKHSKIFLFCISTVFIFTACRYPYPDMVNIFNVQNLNHSYGSYLNWAEMDNASEYNVYTISSKNVKKVLTTNKTSAFIDAASTDIAISAIINGKETYLSSTIKGNNSWWTSVKCTKLDTGYSLSWKKLPIAEDYVLISRYEVTYAMNEYVSASYELKTSNLNEYNHQPASSNPYNTSYLYRKCKSLNTTENNTIFTDTCFNSGMYSYYVCLYAKIGGTYYQISDIFHMK